MQCSGNISPVESSRKAPWGPENASGFAGSCPGIGNVPCRLQGSFPMSGKGRADLQEGFPGPGKGAATCRKVSGCRERSLQICMGVSHQNIVLQQLPALLDHSHHKRALHIAHIVHGAKLVDVEVVIGVHVCRYNLQHKVKLSGNSQAFQHFFHL